MSAEILNFKVTLCPGVLHRINKFPEYRITLDGVDQKLGSLTEESTISFGAEVGEGEHTLQISFVNKDHTCNTFVDADGKIVEDLFIHLTKLEIDDIDLENLLSHSVYDLATPVEFNGAQVSSMPNHRFMSWNGTITLKFTSPFYLWLLENL